MAESKRIFNRGSVDRDIDDRLLPEGQYRDALNVNVGVSEGGDIGAVENLKGNEPVGSVAAGTTIGSVRDPNNDRVYWFNTSDTVDAIYEYDETTGEVTTILREPKARTAVLPTCAPELISRITEPRGDQPFRLGLPPLPAPPRGGCTQSVGTTNFDSSAEFDDGSCIIAVSGCTNSSATNFNPAANVDDGSCIFGTGFGFADTGTTCSSVPQAGTTDAASLFSSSFTIDSVTPSTVAENTGTTSITHSFSITVSGTIPTGQGFTNEGTAFTVTGSEDCVQPGTAPLTPFSFSVSTSDTIDNATSNGAATISGTDVGTAAAVSTTSGIAADTGFVFTDASLLTAALTVTGGGAHTLSLTQNGASATLSGDVFDAGSASIAWSGTGTEAAPLSTSITSWGAGDGVGDDYAVSFGSVSTNLLIDQSTIPAGTTVEYSWTSGAASGTFLATGNAAATLAGLSSTDLLETGTNTITLTSAVTVANPLGIVVPGTPEIGTTVTIGGQNPRDLTIQAPEWGSPNFSLSIDTRRIGRRATMSIGLSISGGGFDLSGISNNRGDAYVTYNLNGRSYTVGPGQTGNTINEGSGFNQITNGGILSNAFNTQAQIRVVHVFDETFNDDFMDTPGDNVITVTDVTFQGFDLTQTDPDLPPFPTFPVPIAVTNIVNQEL